MAKFRDFINEGIFSGSSLANTFQSVLHTALTREQLKSAGLEFKKYDVLLKGKKILTIDPDKHGVKDIIDAIKKAQ